MRDKSLVYYQSACLDSLRHSWIVYLKWTEQYIDINNINFVYDHWVSVCYLINYFKMCLTIYFILLMHLIFYQDDISVT